MVKKGTGKRRGAQEIKIAVKEFDKLVNWAEVFPRSGRPDLRKKPTRHQRKVINQLEEMLVENGGAKRFHGVRRSKRRDILQAATGTESIFKGYFSQGEMRITGDWAVLDIKKAGVELYYRGFNRTPRTEIEAAEFTAEALKTRPHVKVSSVGLSNKGGQFDMVGIEQDQRLIDKARATYLKYAEMARTGQKRDNYYGQLAAHPRLWMTGIAFTRQV